MSEQRLDELVDRCVDSLLTGGDWRHAVPDSADRKRVEGLVHVAQRILHLDGASTTMVNGRPIEWASLADGDQVAIGPYVLTFVRNVEEAGEQGSAGTS